jgi:DHA1 family multidrug resistance protein-like MFS transporter
VTISQFYQSTLASNRSGSLIGTALELRNVANNLGQVIGPLLGGTLFAWRASAPYLITSISMLAIGAAIGLHRIARLSAVSLDA